MKKQKGADFFRFIVIESLEETCQVKFSSFNQKQP